MNFNCCAFSETNNNFNKKPIFFISRRIRQEMKRWCNSLPTNPRKLFFCQTSKNFEVVRFAGLEVCNWASRPPRNFRKNGKKSTKQVWNRFRGGNIVPAWFWFCLVWCKSTSLKLIRRHSTSLNFIRRHSASSEDTQSWNRMPRRCRWVEKQLL